MTGQFNQCAFDENCKGTELFSLKECNKDTISHLRFFKCGTDMNIPESLLILNRAGLGLRLSNVIDKYICNQHRQQYGLQWKRKKRTCCHPLHDIAKSAKVARGINLTQSREIWLKLNLNIAVGSGKKNNDMFINIKMARYSSSLEYINKSCLLKILPPLPFSKKNNINS